MSKRIDLEVELSRWMRGSKLPVYRHDGRYCIIGALATRLDCEPTDIPCSMIPMLVQGIIISVNDATEISDVERMAQLHDILEQYGIDVVFVD